MRYLDHVNLHRHLLFVYICLKILTVVIAYYINKNFFGNQNFFYGDMNEYNECNLRSYNYLFTAFNCLFGINNISNIYTISIAFLVSSFRDILFILISSKFLKSVPLLLFVICLSTHPYMAIYHPRFVTGLFASCAFLFVFWLIVVDYRLNFKIILVFAILTAFRNGLMPFFIVYILLETFRNYLSLSWSKILMHLLSVVLIFVISQVPEKNYSLALINDNDNYFSYYNIHNSLSFESKPLSYLISFPIVFITHFILLLGFREAVFTDGPAIFLTLDFANILQLSIFVSLFIFHFVGLISFYFFFQKRDIRLLGFLAYFFPSMLFVAHMRYFVPMMPLVTLGIALLIQKYYFDNKRN